MHSLYSFYEHFKGSSTDVILPNGRYEYCFGKRNYKCFDIEYNGTECNIQLSYFVGVDWIIKNQHSIFIEPKLNKDSPKQTNYLGMLFSVLSHPEIEYHAKELYEIKVTEPYIDIKQEQDLLTPLLVIHFLKVVKEIARKGLKKSYYKVERDLNSRVKGKILVGRTINRNIIKNKDLYTTCSYDEFGVNGLENRLLKKTLGFIQRYLPRLLNKELSVYTTDVFNYVLPAFESVSEEVNLHEIKYSNYNVFYKEYSEGIRLAKLILKRFGYNITNIDKDTISTPPFWIDMSKLFELFVFGKLIDSGHRVIYQPHGNYGYPDYLLLNQKMIVDAKYKTYYKYNFESLSNDWRDSIASDIRQVSGYARDKEIMKALGCGRDAIIDCLIIYPDQSSNTIALEEALFKNTTIEQFEGFYKIAVQLPVITLEK